MSVLEEIVEWSRDRPGWQREALRRLVLNDELTDEDVRELTEICKSAHGLAEPQQIVPLAKDHVPTRDTAAAAVTLVSIFHLRGVNALAENQTLKLGRHLTVVYGDNAAGKTGYIRILKSACRARGPEKILGNVVSGAAPQTPVVAIKYRIGDETDPREWAGGAKDDSISRVSVFDTQSAAVYLTEKTDVAFRPFGLDLFDKLVRTCKFVRTRLESEQRGLGATALPPILTQVSPDTAVGKLLAGISSLTRPERVRGLARLSAEEETRLGLLESSLLDLQANDPAKLVQQLSLRAARVRGLARHLRNVESVLASAAVSALLEVRAEGRRKSEEASRLRAATFPVGMLPGTGADFWSSLWEAARRFSQEAAYPTANYPFIDEGAKCVLCQQDLDHDSRHRFKQFAAFVASTTERELRELRERFARLCREFTELKNSNEASQETISEIRIEQVAVADAMAAAIATNERRREAVLAAISEDADLSPTCPALISAALEADALAVQLEERVRTLGTSASDELRKQMTSEVQELRARKLLAQHEQAVLSEIERKKKVAAYELCLNDTRTQAITQKSTGVTRTAVTQKLKRSFQQELANLSFRQIEVELTEVGGTEGVLYHKLVLTRAPGVELPKVVSEGEQRCLSIAAFFAELSTADDPATIVFDDPVSSLDYKWREGVARRLVQEAKTRQVIVFTHDVVFLLFLKQFCREMGIDQFDQHVQALSKGAGVCVEELPWVAMPVNKKIGHLKSRWQSADKLFREGHKDAYEGEAQFLYGLLRAAWERAVEEVLLENVVERFRSGIQTLHIGKIADINPEDCRALEAAMTKCSRWLPGHDQAAAARAPIPEPADLKADIEALESWVGAIRARRR